MFKPATTIRFFNRGEFYTVHGADALFTAKEWFKTTAFIKTYSTGDDKLESLIVNKGNFEAYIRDLLLVKHYRVEVYTGGAKTNNWILEFKGSPGNLSQFEDLLFESVDQIEGSAVIAVKIGTDPNDKQIGAKVAGIALFDCMEQKMSLCEITDDEYFSNTEALIVQLDAKECLLVSDNSPENDILKKVIERSGILVTMRKRSDFNTDNLVQDLNRLIKFKEGQQQNAMTLPQMNHTIAIGAMSAIIKYLELTSNQENFGQFKLENIENQCLMHIDCAALKALSIIPPPHVTAANKHHSVFGLLDKCRTSHGRRLLMQWVRQPLRDMNAINERHEIVETLYQDTEVRQELYDEHLRKIPDFQSLAKKLQRNKATMQDCYRVYQGISKLPSLIKTLKSCDDGNPHHTLQSAFISTLEEQYQDMAKFQEMMESTLDMSLVDRGEFLIRPEFDEELQEMRAKMENLESKMRSQLSKVASALNLQENKTIKLESNSQFGHFLRISLKDAKMIQSNNEYELLDTHKAGVRFRNHRLTKLNEDYSDIYQQYSDHQKGIVSEVIGIASGYCNTLQYLSSLIASLDVLVSFAVVAVSAPTPYVRPKMLPYGSGSMKLKQARHPCVEMQDNISYIPNDVNFQQDSATLYLITGPNMGGKSTYIRSIGVVALLAHVGSFVPCEEAEIPILDAILARVGANDSQIKGMSTFMVEMVETSSIIRRATSNSLVIIDELGRGTSTYEGCGIACAIVEFLANDVKSFTLFATHFHELTLLAEKIKTIHNLHVSAIMAEDRLTHLYQIKRGACDQSFGIHVAKIAKFPSKVVEVAEHKLEELEDFLVLKDTPMSDEDRTKILKEGGEVIDEFLNQCKELRTKNLDKKEFEKEFNILKQAVLDKKNPYIEALLKKTS
ncbi:hypothetical protein PGB90_001744 [Kerria lacca]